MELAVNASAVALSDATLVILLDVPNDDLHAYASMSVWGWSELDISMPVVYSFKYRYVPMHRDDLRQERVT